LERTLEFWRFVSGDYRYEGRWEAAVRRSMLALHLLIYAPTGAVCAAATTSLPERIGGERTWDYRFCWLRDAAFTMDVFHRLGHTAYTRPFIEWLAHLRLCDEREDIHSLFGIGLEANHETLTEVTLEHLEGYRGSRPVRVGNAATTSSSSTCTGDPCSPSTRTSRRGGEMDGRSGSGGVPRGERLAELAAADNGIWGLAWSSGTSRTQAHGLGGGRPRLSAGARPPKARRLRPLAGMRH
jgi:hypothetical protein